MDHLPAFLKNKRLLIALGIIILLFLIISAVIFSTNPNRQVTEDAISPILTQNSPKAFPSFAVQSQVNSSTSLTNPYPTQIIRSALINNQPVTPQPEVWLIGDHDLFTINYLSGWNPEINTVYKGGTAITIKPAVLPAGDVLPNFHIEVTASDSAYPLSEKVKFFSPLGLARTDITFHDLPAIRLSGTMPFTPLPDNPNQSLIHKTYTFVDKQPNTYVITYAYYLNADANKYQQIFDSMLDSFRFK